MKNNFIVKNQLVRELQKENSALKKKLEEQNELIEMLKFDVSELSKEENATN